MDTFSPDLLALCMFWLVEWSPTRGWEYLHLCALVNRRWTHPATTASVWKLLTEEVWGGMISIYLETERRHGRCSEPTAAMWRTLFMQRTNILPYWHDFNKFHRRFPGTSLSAVAEKCSALVLLQGVARSGGAAYTLLNEAFPLKVVQRWAAYGEGGHCLAIALPPQGVVEYLSCICRWELTVLLYDQFDGRVTFICNKSRGRVSAIFGHKHPHGPAKIKFAYLNQLHLRREASLLVELSQSETQNNVVLHTLKFCRD